MADHLETAQSLERDLPRVAQGVASLMRLNGDVEAVFLR
jgi:hypothetical protein